MDKGSGRSLLLVHRLHRKGNGSIRPFQKSHHLGKGNLRDFRLIKSPGPVFVSALFGETGHPLSQFFSVYLEIFPNHFLKLLLRYPVKRALPQMLTGRIGNRAFVYQRIQLLEKILEIQLSRLLLTPVAEKQVVSAITYGKNVFPVKLPAPFVQGFYPPGRIFPAIPELHDIPAFQMAASGKKEIPLFCVFPVPGPVCRVPSIYQLSVVPLVIFPFHVHPAVVCVSFLLPG